MDWSPESSITPCLVFSGLLSTWRLAIATSSWRTSWTRQECKVRTGGKVTREKGRSSLNSLEKIHGALAQAVYMDPGVKINYERTKALGNGVESLGL